MAKIYSYGMRLRGFSPGAQPMKNLISATEDTTRTYWSILEYSSALSETDRNAYDLDYLGEREVWYQKSLA